MAEQGLNGAGLIVVDEEDGVVHEEYWGEFEADRISLIASVEQDDLGKRADASRR